MGPRWSDTIGGARRQRLGCSAPRMLFVLPGGHPPLRAEGEIIIGFAVLPFRQRAMRLHWALPTRKSISTTQRLRGSVRGASRTMPPSHS